MSDIVEWLRKPIDADKIYDWIVAKRKETRSDLPRLGFCNSMELIDEERAEAAAEIRRLRAELSEARDENSLWAEAVEELAFRNYWRIDGMRVGQARIHAKAITAEMKARALKPSAP